MKKLFVLIASLSILASSTLAEIQSISIKIFGMD